MTGADRTLTVEVGARRVTARVYDARGHESRATLVLAHGAGAGQQSPFMVTFARALAAHGIDLATFDFLYMAERRRVPDRREVLEACYRAALVRICDEIASARERLFIGGKSMGGRIASQIAAASADASASREADVVRSVAGLVLLGYPLHPPGRPEQRRDAHLAAIGRPILVVQGSRDTFGTPAELAPVFARMDPHPTLYVVEGGDHSFKVRSATKAAQSAVYDEVQHAVAHFVRDPWN